MKTILFLTLMIFALLARLLSGCMAPTPGPTAAPPSPTSTPTPLAPTRIPPSPTPEVLHPNYTNAATGLSIWYPDDWACEEFVEEVIFASSEEIIAGAELTSGAALMVTRSELEGASTIEELVETTLRELTFEQVDTSDCKPHTIGGRQGILVTLQGTPQGADVTMRGFLAGAEHEGWGYIFLAATMLHQWSEYGPTLETMLDSVCFRVSEGVYTSAALGLSLSYPEGWTYEEQGQQVIFGTSEEIISGAELETGAVMLIIGSPLEESGPVEEMFQMMLSEMPFGDMEISDTKPHSIGGQHGILVTFEGTPAGEELPLKGFLAAAEHKGWGYLFLGISALDEWCEYEPVLDTMLDSVQFTE